MIIFLDKVTSYGFGCKCDIFDALASVFGSYSANDTNVAISDKTNATMIELANTAHQREVADLVKAGLNPVLSVDGAGAPVPALNTAKVENTMKNGLQVSQTLNSAADLKLKTEQADNIEAQTKNLDVQNEKLKAEIDSIKAGTEKKEAETRYPGATGSLLRSAGNAVAQPFRWAKRVGDEIEKRTDTGHWRLSDVWPFNRWKGANSAKSVNGK